MHDILHTVYLKHDTSFKSLNKRALAQIILKIVFQSGNKGILSQIVRTKLVELTSVKFDSMDIENSLQHLVRENKLHSKSGRFYIKESYKPTISQAVQDSEDLHISVINYWFSKSETFNQPDGLKIIRKWFQTLLIRFFKEYSYDWMNDLKLHGSKGKRRSSSLDDIIDLSFIDSELVGSDIAWLKIQFISFIESDRKDDNDLLWIYGISMFSSTLLTAKNFADDLSLDIFRDTTFILDTNILMILELEGFEKSYAIQEIARVFDSLKIDTKYFYISKKEYERALQAKREAILLTINKFDFAIIAEVECPFMKTAIKRQCKSEEDFEQFFDSIMVVPNTFGESYPLSIIDYPELNEAISRGEDNETVKQKIDKIYENRTSHHKRERPKQHDAGIIEGTKFLNKSKKTIILTRDSILREYAYDNAIRDEKPIAIGFDSLIQMLAINSGGTDREATNFAPLFSKLVSGSLMPENDTFRIEDLSFMLETKIKIGELSTEQIKKIAHNVNKLRLKGVEDEDIVLEIQRSFQFGVNSLSKDMNRLSTEKSNLELENRRIANINKVLESQLYKSQYHSLILSIKKQIAISWLKLLTTFLVSLACIFYAFKLTPLVDNYIQFMVNCLTSVGIAFLVNLFGFKGKLWITSNDKELARQEISKLILNLKVD